MSVRILVTGGAGFIGSHVCDRLHKAGHHVVCLDNFETGSPTNVSHLADSPRFELVERDVQLGFGGEGPAELDRIYHLACPASPPKYQRDPVRTLRTAFGGTLQMLELAVQTDARLLLTSTSEVYGDPLEHPQRESYRGNVNTMGPRACYDEGKRIGESLCWAFRETRGVSIRVARIFNTYGPRMRPDDGRVVSNFIRQALAGQPLTIFGDGTQTRSFCYVDDLLDGLLTLMESSEDPGPINLGNPKEHQISELVALVSKLTSTHSPVEQRPLPVDDPVRRCPSIERAIELLQWSPQISLEEGLIRTIAHFRKNNA